MAMASTHEIRLSRAVEAAMRFTSESRAMEAALRFYPADASDAEIEELRRVVRRVVGSA